MSTAIAVWITAGLTSALLAWSDDEIWEPTTYHTEAVVVGLVMIVGFVTCWPILLGRRTWKAIRRRYR